jgi:hypothetical protein
MIVVLVMLNNLQDYIFDNIKQLLLFENQVVVITDNKFLHLFDNLNVILIDANLLLPNYTSLATSLKNTDRGGFYLLTSYRFVMIAEYMKSYNVSNIVHVENDVLVYTQFKDAFFHDRSKILVTLDAHNRCIPGLMFISNVQNLELCLKTFDPVLNDMQNWAKCAYNPICRHVIDTLPIGISTHACEFVTNNYSYYGAIFDAAAIGQYLGGVDPRNIPGNIRGFINETCVINYSKFSFHWEIDTQGRFVPKISKDDTSEKIPIINLHIHSKKLCNFLSTVKDVKCLFN